MMNKVYIIRVSHVGYIRVEKNFPAKTALKYLAQKFLTVEAAKNAIRQYKEWMSIDLCASNRRLFDFAEAIEL